MAGGEGTVRCFGDDGRVTLPQLPALIEAEVCANVFVRNFQERNAKIRGWLDAPARSSLTSIDF